MGNRIESRATVGVLVYAACVVAFYTATFCAQALSADPQHWGQFGDYIGGLLNPIVAFAALLLLVESIRIQRKELAETKEAITRQADTAAIATEIAALTGLIQTGSAEVEMHRAALRHIAGELSRQTQVIAAQYNLPMEKVPPDLFDRACPVHDDRGNLATRESLLRQAELLRDRVTRLLLAISHHQAKLGEILVEGRRDPARAQDLAKG
jgi:hypothetical protein